MRHIRPEELPADAQARAVLARFCREARRLAPDRVRSVVVYGSMARGDADEDSDLDLWVDWDGPEPEGRRLLGNLAADLFLETGIIVSVHIVAPEHLRRMRAMDSLFLRAVEREGAVVDG